MEVKSSNAKEQVSEYIAALPAFSKAICERLRDIILKADEHLTEEWKWGPHYSCHGMVCGYAGFQKHVKVTFFNGSAMADRDILFNHCVENQFSRSIKYTNAGEIDASKLTGYIRESIRINQEGFKRVVKNKTVNIPEDLNMMLQDDEKAKQFFESLSYGYKKEFVDWITTAKRAETRKERIDKTIFMCTSEKRLNEKYKG